MKKLLTILLSLIMLVAFAGCGFYTPPIGITKPGNTTGGGHNKNPEEGGDDEDGDGDDEPEEGLVFRVQLVSGGKAYTPKSGEEITVIWSGNGGFYQTVADKNGVAKCNELDGEYHVTLEGVPEGYTYDPNGYMTDNDTPHIEVELLKILATYDISGRNPGTGKYQGEAGGPINFRRSGTYRVILDSASRKGEFEFEPAEPGMYAIDSWVDVTENMVNPTMEVYSGNKMFKNDAATTLYDGGGISSTFTKNFHFYVELGAQYVGNGYCFKLYASSQKGYPVSVDFTLKYLGDYVEPPEEGYIPSVVKGPFKKETPAGTFRYLYKDNAARIQDTKRVGLGSDGFYYIKDAAGNLTSTKLFCKINRNSEVIVAQSMGQIIDKGFTWHVNNGGLIRLVMEGIGYYNMIDEYAKYCNADGVTPVTEELKDFFHKYAVYQDLFMDGKGSAETPAPEDNFYGIQAAEDSMWLFNCGYYA